MLALFAYVVLILVIMPALIYGASKLVFHFTKRAPGSISVPADSNQPGQSGGPEKPVG